MIRRTRRLSPSSRRSKAVLYRLSAWLRHRWPDQLDLLLGGATLYPSMPSTTTGTRPARQLISIEHPTGDTPAGRRISPLQEGLDASQPLPNYHLKISHISRMSDLAAARSYPD